MHNRLAELVFVVSRVELWAHTPSGQKPENISESDEANLFWKLPYPKSCIQPLATQLKLEHTSSCILPSPSCLLALYPSQVQDKNSPREGPYCANVAFEDCALLNCTIMAYKRNTCTQSQILHNYGMCSKLIMRPIPASPPCRRGSHTQKKK